MIIALHTLSGSVVEPRYDKDQHILWARKLKRWFEDNFDYVHCEYCGTTEPPIDIAHRKKRFDIDTEEEYFMAVMLCRYHHNWAEWGSHERMYWIITKIILMR